jgi:hypothetical protein
MGFFRFVAFLLLVGLLAVVGVNIYNAGVTAGINSDIGHAIASGAAIPGGFVSSAYLGQPGGFGFGGFFIGLFVLFLFFGLMRAAFGMGRMGGHHGGYGKWSDRRSSWQDHLGTWHEEQHGKAPESPAPDKA